MSASKKRREDLPAEPTAHADAANSPDGNDSDEDINNTAEEFDDEFDPFDAHLLEAAKQLDSTMIKQGGDDDDDDEDDEEGEGDGGVDVEMNGKPKVPLQSALSSSSSPSPSKSSSSSSPPPKKVVWRPGLVDSSSSPSPSSANSADADDGELEYDSSAYTTFHRFTLPWPSLSFDVLPDTLGSSRLRFPLKLFVAVGTQAADNKAKENKLMILKLSNLQKTQHDDEEGDDEDDEDDEDEGKDGEGGQGDTAILEEKGYRHSSEFNRVRLCPQMPNIAATLNVNKLNIWDIEDSFQPLDLTGRDLKRTPQKTVKSFDAAKGPFYSATINKGKEDTWALHWSPVQTGRLAVGGADGNLHIFDGNSNLNSSSLMTFSPHSPPSLSCHKSPILDCKWSPSESHIICTASADKTIRIWDIRVGKSVAFVVGHHGDVNTISWNSMVQNLIASGGDDNHLKVWDLKNFKSNAPLANFNYHKKPIYSVEWHPTEESIIAAASGDDSVSIWDLGLEADEEEIKKYSTGAVVEKDEDAPSSLYFIHAGLKNLSEIHWHPQIPSLLIASGLEHNGDPSIHVFKAQNLDESEGVKNNDNQQQMEDAETETEMTK